MVSQVALPQVDYPSPAPGRHVLDSSISTWCALSGAAGKIVEDRAAHQRCPQNNGSRPGQPEQASLSPQQELVFQQRDASEDRQVRVSANVLQILERGISHLLDPRQNDSQNQTGGAAGARNRQPVRL